MRGEELPTEYQSAQRWHCVYCNALLDRYRDFWPQGDFRSDDYLCLGCDFVNEQGRHFNRRGYTDRSKQYLTLALERGGLPAHIMQAYHRQLLELPMMGVYLDEPITPSD